jgi:hypothetical protein
VVVRPDPCQTAGAEGPYDAYGKLVAHSSRVPVLELWGCLAQRGFYPDNGTGVNLCPSRNYERGRASACLEGSPLAD